MPVDLADLKQKVQDQISALYAQRGTSALGAPQVAFEPLGISVPRSAFQTQPTDPGPIPALAQRRISTLANQVPSISDGVYFRTEFQIDEFYQYLIFGLQSTGGATTGPLATMLMHGRQLYEEGEIADVMNPGDTIYPTEAEPADWYLPGTADAWSSFRFMSDEPDYRFDGVGSSATIRGTFSFDFDRGVESTVGDVFWRQSTATIRALVPKGAARLADLGMANFDQITPQQLMAAPFSANPISGSDDSTDRLQVGRVFAVRTNGGRYVKVQVQKRYQVPNGFYMLEIRYVGYVPGAAPTSPVPRTLMLRKVSGDALAGPVPKRQWAWTLATASAPMAAPAAGRTMAAPIIAASLRAARSSAAFAATAGPVATIVAGHAAALVPTGRAARMRDLLSSNPRFAFARPRRVDSQAEARPEGLELSFELRAVSLHRPWMSLGILADRQWFLPGYRAGQFAEQVLPAIPVTMLVARNVVVKVRGSSSEAAMNAVGFGPFSLANRQASVQPAAGTTESTLSAPTPQIIGWVVQPLKGIAPVADPALPPQ